MQTQPLDGPVAPCLRSDLIFSRHDAAGPGSLVVKDPSTGRFFRFGHAEAFIVRLLDGSVPLETIRRRAEERFSARLSPAALEEFVDRLRGLGLIDTGGQAETGQPRRTGRVRGHPLALRVKAFDPDLLLQRLARPLAFLFTRSFLILSAACIVSAVLIALTNRAEIAAAIPGLANLKSIVLAWVTLYAVVVVHELAHGLACKHFGGSVHEMGFLFIYLQPAFYCNVSDAWLFPEKSRRLWVTFAGAYVEILLWALATFAWRMTEPGTMVSQLALVVMATSVIKTLFNLNPLIKLDGYYLLSDLLDVPNLRQKAFAHLRATVRGVFGGRPADVPRPTPREARIYLMYGVVAGGFSIWLLTYMGLWIARALVGRYQAWGLGMFLLLLWIIFRPPINRFIGRLPAMVRAIGAPRAALAKSAKVLAVVAPVFAILYFTRMDLTVSGEFNVLPARNAEVRAEVEGIIEEVRVEEGVRVARGDVIARLSDRDFLAEIRRVTAQIEEGQARLRMLQGGPRAEERALARTAVEKAEERVSYAGEKLKMTHQLFEQRLVSAKEFGDAREDLAVRRKELEEAEGRLRVLQAGSRPEEIESVEAELRRLNVNRTFLEGQLQRLNVLAPIDGIITTPRPREKIGAHVEKGDLIVKVDELDTVTAEIAVPESEISDVSVGQEVSLRARSLPRRTFHGVVTAIAPTVTRTEGVVPVRTVTVLTRLDNPTLLLKPQMSGVAKIRGRPTRLASLLTRRLSHTLRVDLWSWW
jgi:multidrug resistance efflux pump